MHIYSYAGLVNSIKTVVSYTAVFDFNIVCMHVEKFRNNNHNESHYILVFLCTLYYVAMTKMQAS